MNCGHTSATDFFMSQDNSTMQNERPHQPQPQVSCSDVKQLLRDLESMELALQKTRADNAALQSENKQKQELWEAERQQLRMENATLRESRGELDSVMREVQALREQKEAQEKAHQRDIAELEGMLNPLMEENCRLSKALAAANARLEEAHPGPCFSARSTVEVEPEIERSCDLDRVLKQIHTKA
jgi:chromosome segregation ATPase